MHGAHAIGPCLGDVETVTAFHGEAETSVLAREYLKAGRVDDGVDLGLDSIDNDAVFGDGLNALSVGVKEVHVGLVKRLKILVVETRALAEEFVPRLQLLRRFLVCDNLIDPCARANHVGIVRLGNGTKNCGRCKLLLRNRGNSLTPLEPDVSPTILQKVVHLNRKIRGHGRHVAGSETVIEALLPARCSDFLEPVGVKEVVVSSIHTRWRALHHKHFGAGFGELRNHLNRRSAGTDDGNALARDLVQRLRV